MRVVLVALLLLAAAMAGCATKKGDDDGDGDGTSGTASGSKSGSKSGSGTGSPGNGTGSANNATLTADVVNGTAPLAVNFTMTASPGASSWRLSFGDGAFANGTGVPSAANHTYTVGGNFSANLTVVYSDAPNAGPNVTVALNITVAVPAGNSPPDVLHFEFADSLGCAGDAGADNCISFVGGPETSGIDGYWQALDERYWGLSFTTTVNQVQPAVADSDCAITDADHVILEEPNNGSSPCAGTVPQGAAWIFLYPYALPALAQTLTFTV